MAGSDGQPRSEAGGVDRDTEPWSSAPSRGERDSVDLRDHSRKDRGDRCARTAVDAIVQDELTTIEPAMIARLTPRNDRIGSIRWARASGCVEGRGGHAIRGSGPGASEWRRRGPAWAWRTRRRRPGWTRNRGRWRCRWGAGTRCSWGVGSPLSQVQGVGLYGPLSEAELERMETFYRERGAPIQLELASLADATLLGLLSRRGYRAVEQTHVLVRPLGSREPAGDGGIPSREGPGRRCGDGGRGRADPAGRGGDLGRVGAPMLLRRAGGAAPPAPGRRDRDGLDPRW